MGWLPDLHSAIETVSPKLQSTIDAAALCKMADRGQIAGGLVDGPLAFDNADILIVPDLESGNILAKQLESLADAEAAGIVLAARVPIVLTSRSDSSLAHQASCALALLLVHNKRKTLLKKG